jgi:hypothetical protein
MQRRECGWSQARSGVFTGWRRRRDRHWLCRRHFFTEIGRRCDNVRSYDDIACGIAGIAFCLCCAAIFAAAFLGSI